MKSTKPLNLLRAGVALGLLSASLGMHGFGG